jgi:NAD(P)-dependent dehydrogenase (short-subunit alcohol dehydrogenase family)
MDVKGQTAIVTGAASGLGAATARALASAGAKVGLIDLNAEALSSIAQEIGASAAAADVSNGPAMEEAFASLRAANGPARILIACAGVASGYLIVDKEGKPVPLEKFARVVNINLIGTFNSIRLAAADMAALDPLEDDERGVMITTTSIAAFEGQVGQSAYSASKGGVHALTLPVARELQRHGIRTLCFAPGLFKTPMMMTLPEKVQEALVATTVFPKRLGRPEEFADLALHVIGNPILNGETIRLDGAIRLAAK